jgi:hypothetical protein
MPAADLREVRAVTGNYFFWQGLRWVPIGASLIFLAASLLHPALLPAPLWPWGGSLVLAVALWLSTSVLGRYYHRTFGDVRADATQHERRTTIKWFVAYPAMIASVIFDLKLGLPILLSGLVWGLAIEAYRRSTGGGRPHYSIAAGLLAAGAFLPLLAPIPTGRDGIGLLVGAVGIIYVVGGVLDHRALVRLLGKATPR